MCFSRTEFALFSLQAASHGKHSYFNSTTAANSTGDSLWGAAATLGWSLCFPKRHPQLPIIIFPVVAEVASSQQPLPPLQSSQAPLVATRAACELCGTPQDGRAGGFQNPLLPSLPHQG